MPDTWAGKWQVTVTYRDAVTNRIRRSDAITASIRPGEPFGVLALADRLDCTGSISDARFEVHCSGHATSGLCAGTADVQAGATRTGQTLSGTGISRIDLTGTCDPFTSSNDTITIAGMRLSLDYVSPAPKSSFVESFAPQIALIGLLQ